MKVMKKALSVFVCFLLCIVALFPMKAQAMTFEEDDMSLQQAINEIKAGYPNSSIEVIDGEIHVYVDLDNNENSKLSTRGFETPNEIEAPNGGLWTSFKTPAYIAIDPNAIIPYGVVFLPGDKAEMLYLSKTTYGLVDIISDSASAGYAIDKIIDIVKTKTGLSFSYTQMAFALTSGFLSLYEKVSINSLANAMQETEEGKVRIDYTTAAGWPATYYYSWTGDFVTDSPWEDFSPTFHAGIYDTSDL